MYEPHSPVHIVLEQNGLVFNGALLSEIVDKVQNNLVLSVDFRLKSNCPTENVDTVHFPALTQARDVNITGDEPGGVLLPSNSASMSR